MWSEEGVLKHTAVYTFVHNSSGLLKKTMFFARCMPSCQSLSHVFCENTCFWYSTTILCTLRTFLPARVSSVALFWPVSFSAQVLVICSSAGLPHGGVCRFQGCNFKAWSGSLDAAFSVDEASVREAVVAHVSFLCLQCFTFRPCSCLMEGSYVCTFMNVTHQAWHGLCLSCMVISSIAVLSLR